MLNNVINEKELAHTYIGCQNINECVQNFLFWNYGNYIKLLLYRINDHDLGT